MLCTITGCDTCPFHVPGGEYDGYCNHPANKDKEPDISIEYNLKIKCETLKTDNTIYGHYHHETSATPSFCPLRSEDALHLGGQYTALIRLDKQLFIENLKK